MTTRLLRRNIKILIINPNSSHEMTRGMEKAIQGMPLHESIEIHTYTAPPASPASINDAADIRLSADVILRDLANRLHDDDDDLLDDFDGVLVACYSVHTLVEELSQWWQQKQRFPSPSLAITGIFEASILTATSLLPQTCAVTTGTTTATATGSVSAATAATTTTTTKKWGVVTTGEFWEDHLSRGVRGYLGQGEQTDNAKFAGVFSTGLTAGDFHHVSPAEVKLKLEQATKRLLDSGDVGCVVMGCAGMAGLEEIIRASAVEVYGKEKGNQVYIIDGVKAGILQLEQMVTSSRLFQT